MKVKGKLFAVKQCFLRLLITFLWLKIVTFLNEIRKVTFSKSGPNAYLT